MRGGFRMLCAGRGGACRAVLAVLSGLLACGPSGRDLRIEPAAAIHRLGPVGEVMKIDGVSKTALGPPSAGPVRIEIRRLPPSRIWIAAARPGGGAAQCSARLDALDLSSKLVASFELPDTARWIDAVADLPAVEDASLTLACDVNPPDSSPIVWARLLAIPRDVDPAPPLLVLLSIDTLRADHVTGFGGPSGATPGLERLGAEGMRFVGATSEATWTLPSHYALLVSKLHDFANEPGFQDSLAATLADAGFATVAVTGGCWVAATFFQPGFDHYSENACKGENDLAWVLERSDAWIDRLSEVPAFLFLHTYAVHETPPAFREWFLKHGPFDVFDPTTEQVEQDLEFYRQLVHRTDADLAALLDRLRRAAEDRPVLVVVVSDHGQAFDEHDNYGHGVAHASVTLHDEIVRVPFIVWGPGLVPPGRTSARPVGLTDVAPSILAAAGIAAPPDMRGADLWPLWTGASDSASGLAGGVAHIDASWALRDETHKLIVQNKPEGDTFQLYEISTDPDERLDRAAQEPDRVRESARLLLRRIAWLGGLPEPAADGPLVFPRADCRAPEHSSECESERARAGAILRNADSETREQLRALGYLADPPD